MLNTVKDTIVRAVHAIKQPNKMKTYNQMRYLALVVGLLLGGRLAHAATITVTSTADTIAADGQVTLREAITSANNNADLNADVTAHRSGAYGNDTIIFDPAVTPTITVVGNHLPAISDNLVISGSAISPLTIISSIYGTNARNSIFYVNNGVTVTFNGLTISAGAAGLCIQDAGGTVTVNNCTLDGQTTTNISTDAYQGILSTFNHSLTLNNSTIMRCGHIGLDCEHVDLTINNCTVYNNANGISCLGATTIMTNCTFNGNGQAINGISAAMSVINCTIAGNTSSFTTNSMTVTRKNTICVDPIITSGGFNTFFTDLGNNLTSGNPGLGSLANNGGPTLTMLPLVGSPAIDGGKNSAPVTTDQRGYPRPVDDTFIGNATGGDGSDIGAVEVSRPNKFFINSATMIEGTSGLIRVFFTVSVSDPVTTPMTVTYTTANGTAVAPGDYTAITGSVNFTVGGPRSKTIGVWIKGDTVLEPNEDFYVNLSNPIGGVIVIGQGVCTIVNDD